VFGDWSIVSSMPTKARVSGWRSGALAAGFLVSMLPAQWPIFAPVHLDGRVVDPQQRPVAAALVQAELDGVEIARCTTNAAGLFTFAALPQAFVVLRATTAAPDIGAVEVDLLGESRTFAEVVLLPARKVSGTLRDDAGKAVEGAWITAGPSDLPLFTQASCMARSDANGHYELTHVVMGPARMRFWAPGHEGQWAAIEGHEDTTSDATLSQGEGCVLEVEIEGGSPEQRATSRLVVSSRSGVLVPLPFSHPEQDQPGHWMLRGWCFQGELAVHLVCTGVVVTPSATQLASNARHEKIAFRFDGDALPLQGTISRAKGPAAAGFSLANVGLVAQPLQSPANRWNRIVTATTADGAFTMQSPVAEGEWFALRTLSPKVVLDANAQNPAWFLGQFLDSKEWSVAVRPAHSVHGVVQSPDGEPAPGCHVSVSMRPRAGEGQSSDIPPILIGVGVSNTDGACDIECLSVPAEVDLVLDVVGAVGQKAFPLAIRNGTRTEFGVCKLDPPAILFGQVRHRDGKPAAASRVRLSRDLAGERDARVIVADREGRFRVRDLPPGAWYGNSTTRQSSVQRMLQMGRESELLLEIK
jgi:hypothetical protein